MSLAPAAAASLETQCLDEVSEPVTGDRLDADVEEAQQAALGDPTPWEAAAWNDGFSLVRCTFTGKGPGEARIGERRQVERPIVDDDDLDVAVGWSAPGHAGTVRGSRRHRVAR